MGQELQMASYGPKDIMGIHGPVSPRAVNGLRVTKGLIWVKICHGPYMGRKLQRAGIILDGPDDAIGPNLDRP